MYVYIYWYFKYLSFSGIGRDTAKKLIEYGAEVIALSRTQSDLDSLQKEVRKIEHKYCAL